MAKSTKNSPDLWKNLLPHKEAKQHKYDHGHALIYGAPTLTGATHLAATACARIGTGLVTVLAPLNKADLYRAILPPHILVRDDIAWHDKRVTAKLYGPGGLSVKPDFLSAIPTVLDADALSDLPEKFSPQFVITPHQGEFDRAFPAVTGSRIERAQKTARALNCHLILKGSETIIAGPDGKTVTNTHASPWLATAGSGDVLAGMITGLLAQKMPVFEACCAAVWVHGDCALELGSYLVAEDLEKLIPRVLNKVLDNNI